MVRLALICIAVFCSCIWPPCYGREVAAQASNPETVARDLVDHLSKGDFDGATDNFDATMRKLLPPKALEQVWQSLVAQAGAFQAEQAVTHVVQGGTHVVFVTCRFSNAVLDAKVVFNSDNEISGLWFVPSQAASGGPPAALPKYLQSDAFDETEIDVAGPTDPLPGTLTMPKGDGPFRAVVLVHGSGPQDRDETIGPNKPFRDLARGLAADGLAVLRYDKRARVYSAETLALMAKDTLTVKEETIDDALAAAQLLRNNKRIDPNSVYVLGHSWGGYLAPRMGKRDGRIAGLVILAGSTRPLEDIILDQFNYIYSLDKNISEGEKEALAKLKSDIAKVKDPKLSTAASPAPAMLLGLPKSYWLDLRAYDPVDTARTLSQPLLILQGGRDYQVTKADYDGWLKGLSERKNVAFKSYPKLNHLFMEGDGPSTPAEYERLGYISPEVIHDISQWVKGQSPGPKRASISEKRQ